MDGKFASNVQLDSAVFQVSSSDNRYDAIACSKGNTELIASGSLDQLVLHLEDAKKFQTCSSSDSFKLLLAGDEKGCSWFTKSTLKRFLHIINSSDASKSANEVLEEMSQLEETRKFHQSLYVKEQQNIIGGALTGGLFGTGAIAQQGNVGPNSSETTKNELLRALDLRLTALKEEILVLLNRAVGSSLSASEIFDLSAFVQRFGTSEFSWLMRCMLLISDCQSHELLQKLDSKAEKIDKSENAHNAPDISQTNLHRPISNTVSPAKLAQIERESSTGSDDSSESSDEGEAVVERSRPLVRSASPRRSASPMRRVQIGRSGSRRSTAIAIKSLSYFPPSQRIPLDKDDESSTCNGETEQPPRRSDNNIRRMSVQDAINLFESKQKDQNPDSQNKKAGLFATKSVLRRWSAGMGDSFNDRSEGKVSDSTSESKSNIASGTEKDGAQMESEPDKAPNNTTSEVGGLTFHADSHEISVAETEIVVSTNICAEQTKSGPEETSDRAMASAEWNRQKEAELNQMLLKMMEVMPGKFSGADATVAGLNSTNQQKGVSHGQNREKRDTKVRTEKGTRPPAKEGNLKPRKETIGLNKSSKTPKTGTVTDKRISPVPQRARRNSSPPTLPKEVTSKTPVRKSSPKPSPAPAAVPTTRSSWSGGSLTKATTTQKTKSSPGMASTSTPTSRRRTPTPPSSSQPSSKVERTTQPVKNKKETIGTTKSAIKGQEEKKTKTATKTSRITKVSPSSEEKSSVTTKQSLHKVSKKSSVVPLESKPLKKATGISQRIGSGTAKSKVPQLDDSSKDSGSVNEAEDKELSPMTTEPTTKVLEADLAQPAHDVDENLEISLDNDLNIEKTETPASSLAATEMISSVQVEPSTAVVDGGTQPPDEDMGISSAAWVEVEHQEQEVTDPSENVIDEDVTSPGIAPLPSSSPRVRHSLSQMLQADSNEPEIIEWGNAENPPAIVFHKDSPKGFKRLLKFARKNKGDNNSNGWASPSVVSEGEDELEESRGTSDCANSSRRTFDGSKTSSILSAQSTTGSFNSMNSDKLRERPGAAMSAKASRSFFSLSNFRSSRSNDSKLR
ncbi:hypothetical protein U9M48_007294 [Paspalum notatum var. saurae]|uniref:COP1-interacting protein 7 n=1 Tax=Paspalum notatum var. saurae TaxID=547442 RepID=A0AAQ3PRF5_PASNO